MQVGLGVLNSISAFTLVCFVTTKTFKSFILQTFRMEKELISKLHQFERKVLPLLTEINELKALANKTGLQEIEVMRAFQWLQNKNILKINKDLKETVDLDSNGILYLKKGLPEKRFINALKNKESLQAEVIKKAADLTGEELNVCIGILKRNNLINIQQGLVISLTERGKKLLGKESEEEKLLKKLPLNLKILTKEELNTLEELKRRKNFIKINLEKIFTAELTDLGKNIAKEKILKEDFVDNLTPEMLRTNSWLNKNFRHYDVEINVPKIYAGKLHPLTQAIDYIKKIWIELGFKEMTGPLVDTSFWDFDALFTPQDHPAREMQDTLFIKDPKLGKLPNPKLVNQVKSQHENSWKYKWDQELSKKLVLRTHTTTLSARTLSNLKQFPAKFFSVGRIFRNETLDWSHLAEFTQTEGIVIDENANFKHLLGYLKEFFSKMGYNKVRFSPGYFSYVEPGLEIFVFDEKNKKWLELGGAGIFRPEVVKPLLGKDIPVLAWGLGVERIVRNYYKINDIRDLYLADLKKIREAKLWMG